MRTETATTQTSTIPSYNSDLDRVIDLMAASVIPLFYADHQHKKRFRTFLREYAQQSPDKKTVVDQYIAVCKAFYALLTDYRESIIEEYDAYEKEYIEKLAEIKEASESYKTSREGNTALIERLKTEGESALNAEEHAKLMALHQCHEKFLTLRQHVVTLQHILSNISQQLTELSTNEISLFIEEVMLFCANPANGPESLKAYFIHREAYINFFLTHENLFATISKAWIDHVLSMKLPLKNHPLPMYLCPFNANEEQFNPATEYKTITVKDGQLVKTIYARTDNPCVEHIRKAEKQGMPFLANLIEYIQEVFFQTSIDYNAGISYTIHEQTLFRNVCRRDTSDSSEGSIDHSVRDIPADVRQEMENGRRTNPVRMFESIRRAPSDDNLNDVQATPVAVTIP